MPYKDPAQQREFARQWAAARRAKYTAGMRCVDCGTTQFLEMDHRIPAEKESHRIWTWSERRLLAELAKCDPRCHDCHVKRHLAERPAHGETGYRKGCRCDECRDAKRASAARYHARVNERQAA